jgi:hypothetical protein
VSFVTFKESGVKSPLTVKSLREESQFTVKLPEIVALLSICISI